MKDDLTALLEAVRRVQAELDAYRNAKRPIAAEDCLERIDTIVTDLRAAVVEAHLLEMIVAPTLAPADHDAETV